MHAFIQHIPIKIWQHHKAVGVHSNEDLYNIFIKCTYDILIQSLGGREMKKESTGSELYSNQRLHVRVEGRTWLCVYG